MRKLILPRFDLLVSGYVVGTVIKFGWPLARKLLENDTRSAGIIYLDIFNKSSTSYKCQEPFPLCCISVRGIPTLLTGCKLTVLLMCPAPTYAWTLTHCILLYLQLHQLMESIIRNGMEEASSMVILPLSYSFISNCTTLSHFDNQLVFHIFN